MSMHSLGRPPVSPPTGTYLIPSLRQKLHELLDHVCLGVVGAQSMLTICGETYCQRGGVSQSAFGRERIGVEETALERRRMVRAENPGTVSGEIGRQATGLAILTRAR
ncbi:hypothetical protein [Streptomyces sp. NBC_01614]|uniref:hypothetical protein n=1 Tax=Streptomyces sp. NBC_01614 TaxID=2975897 RepID=UPI0038641BB6